MCAKPSSPRQPYGSAQDLPSVVEMRETIRGGKLLTRFIARDQRAQLLEVEAELKKLVKLVDDFYALLGPRNWIFPDTLTPNAPAGLVAPAPAEAERRFIELSAPTRSAGSFASCTATKLCISGWD